MKNFIIITLMLSFALGGCATTKNSVLLGLGTGATTGAVSGAMLYQKNKGKAALAGAAIGATIGGIASYFIHKGMVNRDKQVRRETLFNLEKYGVNGVSSSHNGAPAISFPVVEQHQVEAQVKGKKLVGRHKVWVISEDSHWILDGNKKGNR